MAGYDSGEGVTKENLKRFMVDVGQFKTIEEVDTYEFWDLLMIYRKALIFRPLIWNYNLDQKKMRAFNKPVLLFKGTKSSQFFHRITDALARKLQDVRVEWLEGAHRSFADDQETFLKHLNNFFAELETKSRK